MNISSAIVKVISGNNAVVLDKLSKLDGCEIHLYEKERIIITLEAEDINGEIALIKVIEQIDGIISVEMVYAYSEEELEKERDKVEFADETPQWLNNDSMDARAIKYGGDLRKKI